MIAYNLNALDNEERRDKISDAFNLGYITTEEKTRSLNAYPSVLYTPNQMIKLGLFILTIIIIGFTFGLFSLVFEDNYSEKTLGGLAMFLGLVCYGVLEFFVQQKKHFGSGVDDALMWGSGGLLICALNFMLDVSAQFNALIVFLIAFYYVLRFTNQMMAYVATFAFFFFIFYSWIRLGHIGQLTVPVVLLLVATALYFLSKRFTNQHSFRYYKMQLFGVGNLALLIFYVAGNYFVVREFSNEMFRLGLKPGDPLPMGWFYWLCTALTPIIYIVGGLYKKDAILLRVGLLLVAAMVFTIRYYHTIMPLEYIMLLSGIALMIAAYAITKCLEHPKKGFTSAIIGNAKDSMNLEGLLVAETMGAAPVTDDRFGGGSFGGGGASGDY